MGNSNLSRIEIRRPASRRRLQAQLDSNDIAKEDGASSVASLDRAKIMQWLILRDGLLHDGGDAQYEATRTN